MDREEVIDRFFAAWNAHDASALLRLMHPEASYYDAFWQESCSGRHLAKYFASSFDEDRYWYRPCGEPIPLPNGAVTRYQAYLRDDTVGARPVFTGAEVLTLSDGLILTISDYYCDPTSADLAEIAKLAEGQHGRANAIQRGLGSRTAARIKRRLAELAAGSPVMLDPSLTPTKLASHIGCEVMHLFHVLEELQDTTFLDYVTECRARHASTLMVDASDEAARFDEVAKQCGFGSARELDDAFRHTFDLSADEYRRKFAGA